MVGVEFNNASQISGSAAAALARMSTRSDSKDLANQIDSSNSGGDKIDIRTGAAISAPADGRQDPSASTGSYSTTQMVNFSVTYPDGSTMTTSMSEADFQAALKSDDPLALGGMQIGEQTWYGKDAILSTMTGGNTAASTSQAEKTSEGGKTGTSEHSAPSDTGRTMSDATTGEVVAMAVLTSKSTDESGSGGSDHVNKDGGSNQSGEVVEGRSATASLSLNGSVNGMSATISFVSTSVSLNVSGNGEQVPADSHLSIFA